MRSTSEDIRDKIIRISAQVEKAIGNFDEISGFLVECRLKLKLEKAFEAIRRKP